MQIASKTKQKLLQDETKHIDLSDIQISTVPKCSFSGAEAQYYIGLSNPKDEDSIRVMGAVSQEHVETGINKLLGQGWDDIKWPVVLDMKKKLLYHSFEAYQKGTSAILGWKAYFSKVS